MKTTFLLLLLMSHAAIGQVNLNLGLRAYYPFTGNTNDVSGNNNNPAFSNAILTADRNGIPNSAYRFNGTNTYMRVPNSASLNMTNQMSIAAWVRPLGWYTGPCYNNMMVMKGLNDDNPAGNYFIRFSDVYTGCTTPTTTTERFYGAGVIAPTPIVQLNQWYSVVWTYDGTTSRIYVNCELKASATGSLTFTNARDLFMGKMEDPAFPYWLNGDLDEVRIYDRALNQQEVNVLGGCVSVTGTNISNIINTYTPVLAIATDPCTNVKLTVEDASTFNVGDTVLMIQMKGALINTTNTAAFGIIANYRSAGNYEFNYVRSKTGNVIELKNIVTRQFEIPDGKVQLIRVPYYQNVNITSTLTCLPWDGNKGGVLVLNVQDTITMGADINTNGKGFRGGNSPNTGSTQLYCSNNNYLYAAGNLVAAAKGESIADIPNTVAWGKGSPANGGGSGNGHNAGGGGGANGSDGGMGGYQLLPCGGPPFDNRGIGGKALLYNNFVNKVFLGGGGGSGHVDNAGGSNMEGGNGGGIIIMRSKVITSNGSKILSNGNNATQCNFSTFSDCHDGSGGGGAGGTILIENNTFLSTTAIEAKGGKGGDLIIYNPPAGADKIGPGGGGSGGVIWYNSPANPANTTSALNPGANGVIIQNANDPWGSTPGQNGMTLFDLALPFATVPFKPNIDSVRISEASTGCTSFDFDGFGYTNTNPIATWQWYFGDGGTANTQNTSHTYFTAGTYTVKLVVTDINGCKDSITKQVTTDPGPTITKSADTTICIAGSAQLFAAGGVSYSWSPAATLNNASVPNPVATPSTTTMYYVIVTGPSGCSKIDSVKVDVRTAGTFSINTPGDVCRNNPAQLIASGGDLYSWTPAASLNNAAIANPVATPSSTTIYSVQITDTVCNITGNLSATVNVLPLPVITASRSNDIDCSISQSQLSANGASTYSWSPGATLNDPNSQNPVATPVTTTTYIVTGTDASGCSNSANVVVKVNPVKTAAHLMPTAFTPNGDGLNDCYGIKQWGIITQLEFSIYNRWGERIFFTTDPGQCWDGTYKGVPQDPAVFVYMVKAKTTCQPEVFRKGTFALIR